MPDEPTATVTEEWRVTGQPNAYMGVTFPPYHFVWSSDQYADPEAQARAFAAGVLKHGDTTGLWTDGPHLHSRVVVRTAWEARS